MTAPFVLVIALLTVESSYSGDLERPTQGTPDTVQFWFTPDRDWRIKTFAIDHDIHVHVIREAEAERRFGPNDAAANTQKHYGDVTSRVIILEFADPTNAAEVQRTLTANGLAGTLEIGSSGVAFYNPDRARYKSQSRPD
jgi:hypothetical protein